MINMSMTILIEDLDIIIEDVTEQEVNKRRKQERDEEEIKVQNV